MKKIAITLVSVVLLGAGCQKAQPVVAPVVEQGSIYTNTLGNYSFSHPGFTVVDKDGKPATETTNPVYVWNVKNGELYSTTGTPGILFRLEKTTVYPEHRMQQLRAEFFRHVKSQNGEITIKIGSKSGWEITGDTEVPPVGGSYALRYFPNWPYELVISQNMYSEDSYNIVQSLQFTK